MYRDAIDALHEPATVVEEDQTVVSMGHQLERRAGERRRDSQGRRRDDASDGEMSHDDIRALIAQLSRIIERESDNRKEGDEATRSLLRTHVEAMQKQLDVAAKRDDETRGAMSTLTKRWTWIFGVLFGAVYVLSWFGPTRAMSALKLLLGGP